MILFSLSILFFGCAKEWGNPTTKNYPVNGSFTELEVSDAFEVTVSDQVNDVVVTVGEKAHAYVIVKVVNGELQIGLKPGTLYTGKATAVIPANPNLKGIDLSGASSFTGNLNSHDVDLDLSGASLFNGNVEADALDLDLSGSSHFNGTVDADALDLDISGASEVQINGFCQNKMKINITGASNLKAAALETQSVVGTMSGASNADVTVCTLLNVELSGACNLTYGVVSADCHPDINCPSTGGSTVRPRR